MKPLPLILVALLAGAAGAAGGFLSGRLALCCSETTAQAVPAPGIAQDEVSVKPSSREAELIAKVQDLERSLDGLHQDLAELRSKTTRTAANDSPEAASVEDLPSANALAALNKHAIMAVIEEDRAEQARKAEEERKQREAAALQQRAERTAKRVGLDAGQTRQLAEFYDVSRVRMDEMRTALRDGGGPPDQGMREAFQEFRTWSETELTNRFGGELAAKIMEEEQPRMRMGAAGGPGGGTDGAGQGRRGGRGGQGGGG